MTRRLVIVGGGSAGWLTACIVAARHAKSSGLEVLLVESPDIPIIGVGEGTWPSMRATLQRIGFPEDELIAECDATFKQGTSFTGWSGLAGFPHYCHPFSPPVEYETLNPAEYWLQSGSSLPFASFATPQARVLEAGLAPKQARTPPYAFAVNYAYHFDAAKFAARLHKHGVEKLGIEYISAGVLGVNQAESGDITSLKLDTGEVLAGDLFVDCTGQKALLLAGHYGVRFKPVRRFLFNDAAMVAQVPTGPEEPIASTTRAVASGAGWIWDIGLQSRRGIGYVHAGEHCSRAEAEKVIREYAAKSCNPDDISFRHLTFEPGHREKFWVRNCLATGLSAGFVEPLEASSIALTEQAAWMLANQLPANRRLMDIVAERFNRKMSAHWSRIIDFLKLHYVLSRRTDTDYWRRCQELDTCPVELQENLLLWQQRTPWHYDTPMIDELFPSASCQYVLYGMGFRPETCISQKQDIAKDQADRILHEKVVQAADKMTRLLPSNRALVTQITQQYQEQKKQ